MASSSLSPNALAVRAAAGGPTYGLMYLRLAALAYTDEASSQIVNVTKDLPADVASLAPPPVPGATTAWGQWSVDWGPQLFLSDQNLAYIASFRETGASSPVITVVSIRGTDTSAPPRQLLGQILQDTSEWLQVRWNGALEAAEWTCAVDLSLDDDSQPKIAFGTCRGLGRLLSLTQAPSAGGAPLSILQYLSALLENDPSLPIVVTGHSLGACQTTVLALYLAGKLPPGTRILSNPFAPPTAGNAAFAALYDQQFSNGSNFWWNTLDLVPNAYARGSATTPGNLSFAEGLWVAHGGPAPDTIINVPGLIASLQSTLPTYVEPTAGSIEMTGTVASPQQVAALLATIPNAKHVPPDSWLGQMIFQHFPGNYYDLVSKVAGVVAYPFSKQSS